MTSRKSFKVGDTIKLIADIGVDEEEQNQKGEVVSLDLDGEVVVEWEDGESGSIDEVFVRRVRGKAKLLSLQEKRLRLLNEIELVVTQQIGNAFTRLRGALTEDDERSAKLKSRPSRR